MRLIRNEQVGGSNPLPGSKWKCVSPGKSGIDEKKGSGIPEPFFVSLETSLLVFVPLRLHALVVFVFRHFLAAFLLDGTHLDFSFG